MYKLKNEKRGLTAVSSSLTAFLQGIFPFLDTFISVYLTWHKIENDCSNKSISALVNYFHSADCN